MKRLKDKIPVEPLDEIRLARIERSLTSAVGDYEPAMTGARRSVARAMVWPGIAACCAAAAIFLWWRGAQVPEQRAVVAEQAVPSRFEVVTDDSATTLRLARASIEVAPNSRLEIVRPPDQSVQVELEEGRVHCDVEKRPNRPAFVVLSAGVEVRVVGTAFSVERKGSQVAVAVERGVVSVTRGGETVSVRAGESWQTPVVAAVNPKTPEVTDSIPVAPGDPGETPAGSKREHQVRPPTVPAQVTKNGKKTEGTKGARNPKQTDGRVGAITFKPYRAIRGLDPIMKAPAGPPPDVARHYRGLSVRTGDSDNASFALYSLSYWQLYRMRDARAAVLSADRYERRFRRGANAESALWVRVAALCAAGQQSKCRAAAHSYMRRYPGGRFSRHVKGVIDGNE